MYTVGGQKYFVCTAKIMPQILIMVLMVGYSDVSVDRPKIVTRICGCFWTLCIAVAIKWNISIFYIIAWHKWINENKVTVSFIICSTGDASAKILDDCYSIQPNYAVA